MIYNKSIAKLGITACFITITILLASCGNCRWVEDCRCKDGGYWDCPEDPISPVSNPPTLNVETNGSRAKTSYHHEITFSSEVSNIGTGKATKVNYTINVTRTNYEGDLYQKNVHSTTKTITSISPNVKTTIKSSFMDIPINVSDTYSVSVEVTYSDENGYTYSKSERTSF